jgi:hypothetical protein
LDAKRKSNLFRQECFLPVDIQGLIGVRHHGHKWCAALAGNKRTKRKKLSAIIQPTTANQPSFLKKNGLAMSRKTKANQTEATMTVVSGPGYMPSGMPNPTVKITEREGTPITTVSGMRITNRNNFNESVLGVFMMPHDHPAITC